MATALLDRTISRSRELHGGAGWVAGSSQIAPWSSVGGPGGDDARSRPGKGMSSPAGVPQMDEDAEHLVRCGQ